MKVLIADDESIIRLDLKEMLQEMGHQVVAEAADGTQALSLGKAARPEMAILDIKMPGMDGIEVAEALISERICPVVLLTAYSQRELIDRAREAGVYGYVVKPFQEKELAAALEIARGRYQEVLKLEQEVGDLKEALETRKLVERAKAILMSRHGLSEQEAMRRLQTQSMNTRRPIKEIAQAVILAADTVG